MGWWLIVYDLDRPPRSGNGEVCGIEALSINRSGASPDWELELDRDLFRAKGDASCLIEPNQPNNNLSYLTSLSLFLFDSNKQSTLVVIISWLLCYLIT